MLCGGCQLSSRQIWSGHTQRPFLGKGFPSVRGQYNLSFPISPPSLIDSQVHNQLAAVQRESFTESTCRRSVRLDYLFIEVVNV
jgi:hypothetical protein